LLAMFVPLLSKEAAEEATKNKAVEKEAAEKEAAEKAAKKEAVENPVTRVIFIVSYFYF
jgi:hypothetical protein